MMARAAELIGSQTYFPMESDEPLAELFRDLLDVLPPGDSAERAFALARLGTYLAAADWRSAERRPQPARTRDGPKNRRAS